MRVRRISESVSGIGVLCGVYSSGGGRRAHSCPVSQADRRFFPLMALIAAVVVGAGFAPTYYLGFCVPRPATRGDGTRPRGGLHRLARLAVESDIADPHAQVPMASSHGQGRGRPGRGHGGHRLHGDLRQAAADPVHAGVHLHAHPVLAAVPALVRRRDPFPARPARPTSV